MRAARTKRWWRDGLAVLAALVALAGPVEAAQRVALVIGNGRYADRPLSHPPRDAEDMARLLRELGFEVISPPEVKTLKAMREQVRLFLEAGRTAEVRLFYFSGHGANDGADSYLLPLEYDIKLPSELPDQGYPLRGLLRGLKDLDRGGTTGVNVVLVDACRDAPFGEENKSIGDEYKGLGRVDPVAGTLVAYAAGAGERAIGQASERNSLFTKHLLQRLKDPVPLFEALTNVTGAVQRENDKQLPEIRSQLTRSFYLAQPATAARDGSPPAPVAPPAGAADLIAWQSAERCGTAACYRAYLADHPQGQFANLARAQVERLAAAAPVPPAPPAAPAAPPAAPAAPTFQAGQAFRDKLKDGSDGPAMVVIPVGGFQMGSPESEKGREGDERQHRVKIEKAFALGQFEVTVGEFKRFAEATSYKTDAERNVDAKGCVAWTAKDGKWDWRANLSWRKPGYEQSDGRPVVCASWNDAIAYTEWLSRETGQNYRLPTEAEWEYAARAGTMAARYWGDDPDQACQYANVADLTKGPEGVSWNPPIHDCADGHWHPAPVGRFKPNGWNLHDILGNVWEWTCSIYDKDYGGAETKCSDKDTSGARAVRGGSWDYGPAVVRSASRSRVVPASRNFNTGFRLARSL